MQRYFLQISYNGTHYHGWQIQPKSITVQQVINQALSTLTQENISTIGCGRTDTGVHAKQFFLHFNCTKIAFTPDKFIYKLNSLLPKDIAAHSIEVVNEDMHARFNATERSYEYHFHFGKNVFLQKTSVQIKQNIEVEKMKVAAEKLLAYTDFTSFARLHGGNKTNVCTITYVNFTQNEDKIVFTIRANRFLRNMVRAIVGTLLDVGYGKISIADFEKIIETKNRSSASKTAPAHGLYLSQIKY